MVKRAGLRPRTASSLRKYGLTVEDWRTMLAQQGGTCVICGKGGKTKHLSIDHDHMIEKAYGEMVVRGMLCARCNSGLGRFEWSDDVLRKLMSYVEAILEMREHYLTRP